MYSVHQPGCLPWGSPNPGHFPASAPSPCSCPAWVPFPRFTCPSLPGELLLILQNPFPRYLLWTSMPWGRPATALRLSRVHGARAGGRHLGFSVLPWVGVTLDGKRRGSVHSESSVPRTAPGGTWLGLGAVKVRGCADQRSPPCLRPQLPRSWRCTCTRKGGRAPPTPQLPCWLAL